MRTPETGMADKMTGADMPRLGYAVGGPAGWLQTSYTIGSIPTYPSKQVPPPGGSCIM
jgi:hypothetical protein